MMTKQAEPNVGQQIRTLREQQGLSLRALAERCGLSINAISLIERGENSPTVSSLHRLAIGLGVPIADLFQDEEEQATVLVRRDRRRRSVSDGVVLESLGTGLPDQKLEPFLMILEPGTSNTADAIVHPGEEFVHCLEGEIEYRVGDQTFRLQAGDSLLFEATQPHNCFNATRTPVTILLVFQTTQGRHPAWEHHLE